MAFQLFDSGAVYDRISLTPPPLLLAERTYFTSKGGEEKKTPFMSM